MNKAILNKEPSKKTKSSGTTPNLRHKHYRLDDTKIKRLISIFGTKTATEAINKAMAFTIDEHERNALAWKVHNDFIKAAKKQRLQIRDIFGN
jgi:hypothetical protein